MKINSSALHGVVAVNQKHTTVNKSRFKVAASVMDTLYQSSNFLAKFFFSLSVLLNCLESIPRNKRLACFPVFILQSLEPCRGSVESCLFIRQVVTVLAVKQSAMLLASVVW